MRARKNLSTEAAGIEHMQAVRSARQRVNKATCDAGGQNRSNICAKSKQPMVAEGTLRHGTNSILHRSDGMEKTNRTSHRKLTDKAPRGLPIE